MTYQLSGCYYVMQIVKQAYHIYIFPETDEEEDHHPEQPQVIAGQHLVQQLSGRQTGGVQSIKL